jgi:large-conductance mechanosensitive channel
MMSATSTLAMTHLVTLADSFDKNKVTPGVLGFIVFAIIGGAVWLLMKSMNKQMKKVDFEEQPEEGETATTASAAPKAPEPKTG